MRKVLALVLAFVMVFSLSAVAFADAEKMDGVMIDPIDNSDGSVKYAEEVTLWCDLAGLDPGEAWNAGRESYQRFVFDTLLFYDDVTGEITMQLAKSVEWANEDCTQLHVVLRDDIYFSNGEKVTAADVEYSFGRNTYASMTNNYDHIDIISDTEFDIFLKVPCSSFKAILSRACAMIVCKSEAEKDEHGLALIGSGPYVYDMDSYVAASKIDLVRNEYFWDVENKNPTEVFHLVKLADAAAAAAALQKGEIDYMNDVNESDFAALDANENVILNRYTTINFIYMTFNDWEDTTTLTEEDINFRRAVACAINKDDLVAIAGGGSVMTSFWPFNEECFIANETDFEEDYSYNPEKAKEYLAKAGGRTSFTCLVDTTRTFVADPMQIIIEQLREVGIEMIVEETDSTGMSALTKWGGEMTVDATMWSNIFVIDAVNFNYFTYGSGVNRAHMNNPVVNEAMDTIKSSFDNNVRNEQLDLIQREVHRTVSYLPLTWREMNMAYNKNLENFGSTYGPTYIFRNMRKVVE